MRRINISFIITTKEIPIAVLAKRIGIQPFRARTEFPKNSIAEPYWYIEVSSDSCCIEEPLQELVSVLEPRKSELVEVLEEIKEAPTVLVAVSSDYADRPEMTFPPKALKLFAQLGAEICVEVNYGE